MKTERAIRQAALDQILEIKAFRNGNHKTKHAGNGDIRENLENFILVMVSNASLTESLRNAQINNGVAGFYVNRE
jgi:hypothetical protein